MNWALDSSFTVLGRLSLRLLLAGQKIQKNAPRKGFDLNDKVIAATKEIFKEKDKIVLAQMCRIVR